MSDNNIQIETLTKYMRATVIIQLYHLEKDEGVKPELLLAKAGFTNKEIAELIGKKEDAVRKSISRAK